MLSPALLETQEPKESPGWGRAHVDGLGLAGNDRDTRSPRPELTPASFSVSAKHPSWPLAIMESSTARWPVREDGHMLGKCMEVHACRVA